MEQIDLAQVQDVPEETPTLPDSPSETVEKGEEPSQGGDNTPDEDNLPFHKHPRWIAKQRETEELRAKLEELSPLKDEFEQIKSQLPKQPEPDPEMPDWWKDAFGTDEASMKAFKQKLADEDRLLATMEERVANKIRQTEAQEIADREAQVQKWETHIENEIQALYAKGYTFDKNELLKVVDDYSKDGQGNYTGYVFPFDKAYEILQLKKTVPTPTDTARKNAASQSVSATKSGATHTQKAPTLTEIRQRGWGSWRDN